MTLFSRLLTATLLASLAVAANPAAAQRKLTDIPAPDPTAELADMLVAEGYEVNLFAADPMICKPLQMNFDPQGRLWVSSSSVYPQIQPGEVANDTVTILEDRDGDGRADTHTVFADGLLMPTAVLPGDGGCYVANSTEMLHLADRDGDNRADRRRVVLSGFGAEDTHHIIHTFRWGPDARLFFNQSIYIHSHVETPAGVKRLNGGGIWRFLPRSLALDVYARGWVNTWGHAFDQWHRSLVTDGAGGEGIYYGFPGAAYQAAVGTPRILHGMNPGSPKYCGIEFVDGPHLSDDAQGTLITNDFRANRVCRFRLAEQGSGFSSEQLPDLIRSRRVTFRPIDIKLGPDGAIYIADWYNPIIQHGEVDFRDPRRDREHGRIWRVTAKGRPLTPRIDFTSRSIPELLNDLATQSAYGRDMARRVLWSRDPVSVRQAVTNWLAKLDPAATSFDRLRLEGLRLFQAIDRGSASDINQPLLTEVLGSTDPRARAAAARIAVDWADRLDDPVKLLTSTVADDSMLVRLEGVRALAAIGGADAAALVLQVVDHPRDDALDYAVWLACRELQSDWLPAVVAGTSPMSTNPGRLLFAIEATAATEAIPAVVQLLQSDSLSAADRNAAIDCIARFGGPAELQLAFKAAVDPATPPARTATLLTHLLESENRRRVQPAGPLAGLERLITAANPAVAKATIEAAGRWKVETAIDALARVASDTKRPDPLRLPAIKTLGRFASEAAVKPLDHLTRDKSTAMALRIAAVAALLNQEPQVAATTAAGLLADPLAEPNQIAIFKAFLARQGTPAILAAAIEANQRPLPATVASVGLKQLAGSGRDEPTLKAILKRLQGGSEQPMGRRIFSAAEMAEFLAFVQASGSAARGHEIYRREKLQCVKCHRVGKEGGRVGPNLSTIGVASQPDYIVNSLLEPAKNVKEGYNTLVVLTVDGQVATGIPVSRTETELVLRTADDKQLTIRADDIDEESAGTSLMPVGLVDQLSRQELADLTCYLLGLGREGL
jgi:putative heme-binding domain-containing protein